MAEITGSSIDLATLVQFLRSLGKSGDLLVHRDHWVGLLSLDQGRLIAAAVDNERGRGALEFISVALRDGQFEFFDRQPSLRPNLGDIADPLAELDRLATVTMRLTGKDGSLPHHRWVPRLSSTLAVDDDRPLPLDRGAVYVLLDVDGRRTVRELAERHGHLRALSALSSLGEDGLVTFDAGEVAEPQAPGTAARRQTIAPTPAVRALPLAWPRRVSWRNPLARLAVTAARSEVVRAVVFTGLLILGIRSIVQNFRVEGVSMQPAFQGGQALVVNRAAYFHVEQTPLANLLPATSEGSTRYIFGGPQRGDVAVFHAPTQPNTDYIKRIVGLPGDAVLIRSGRLYINGELMDEPYVKFEAHYAFPEDGAPLTVPDGQYFVLGDNRPESFDSHFGWLVPVDHLVGRVWLRYWPLNEAGPIEVDTAAFARAPAQLSQQAGH